MKTNRSVSYLLNFAALAIVITAAVGYSSFAYHPTIALLKYFNITSIYWQKVIIGLNISASFLYLTFTKAGLSVNFISDRPVIPAIVNHS